MKKNAVLLFVLTSVFLTQNLYAIVPSKNDTLIYKMIIYSIHFTNVGSFHEGLATIGYNKKCGYINKSGKIVIPLKYDYARDFHEDVAGVSLDGKTMFIDKQGKTVFYISPDVDFYNNFSEGLAKVSKLFKDTPDLYGFINKKGEMAIPFKNYERIYDFHNGLARFQQDGKWGFIDKNGNYAIPNIYSEAKDFSEGLAFVKKNDLWGAIDNTGKVVIPFQYENILGGSFHNGLAMVTGKGFHYIIDKNNNKTFTMGLANLCSFLGEGLFGAYNWLTKEYRILEIASGKEVLKLNNSSCDSFHDGLALLNDYREEDGNRETYHGFIDKKGKVIVPVLFNHNYNLRDFSEGYAVIDRNGFNSGMWIDTKGMPLIIENLDILSIEDLKWSYKWMGSIWEEAQDEVIKKQALNYYYRYCEAAALKDDSESCFRMGYLYYNVFPNKDYAEAVKWLEKTNQLYEKSNQLKDTYGETYRYLGYCYSEGGYGITKDESKAFSYFMEGAKYNNDDCYYALAICYLQGEGCDVDLSKAISIAENLYQKDKQKYSYIYSLCYNQLGYDFASKKDYTNAFAAIDKAIAASQDTHNRANFYDSKGEIFLMMGKEDEALKLWNKVMELDKDNLDYYIENSNLYKELKSKGLI